MLVKPLNNPRILCKIELYFRGVAGITVVVKLEIFHDYHYEKKVRFFDELISRACVPVKYDRSIFGAFY
jgi:hypothetical protein